MGFQTGLDLMLQALLADRFKLKVHHETKELPVYALTVAKNGPKLTPSVAPATPAAESAPAMPFGAEAANTTKSLAWDTASKRK